MVYAYNLAAFLSYYARPVLVTLCFSVDAVSVEIN